MSIAPVVTRDEGRVRVITIDRPEVLNAMNKAVFASIRDALEDAATDRGVAVVVITGAGRAFSSGHDMTGDLDLDDDGDFAPMLRRLTTFPKPLIAAVNGLAIGVGMTLLAHCDLVLMADDARMRTPFPQLGAAPEAGSSFTFASRMGWQNAAHVLMSGRWFSAAQCLEMRFVWKVSEPGSLVADTMAVAAEIAANPIPSLVATKQLMLASGRDTEALAAHGREMKVYAHLIGAPANREAVAAAREQRPTDFASIPGL